MRVVAGEATRRHIAESGGAVYVWPHSIRCCGGRRYALDAATSPPGRAVELVHEEPGLAVHATPGLARPVELHLEMSRRGRLEAFWDGQSWIG